METKNNKKLENELDNFLGCDSEKEDCKKMVTKKSDLVEKVEKKLVVEDGRELLREINYSRY